MLEQNFNNLYWNWTEFSKQTTTISLYNFVTRSIFLFAISISQSPQWVTFQTTNVILKTLQYKNQLFSFDE